MRAAWQCFLMGCDDRTIVTAEDLSVKLRGIRAAERYFGVQPCSHQTSRNIITNEEFMNMTQEELHEAARHQPFEPFRLILTTGATFDIHHPDLIMVGRR